MNRGQIRGLFELIHNPQIPKSAISNQMCIWRIVILNISDEKSFLIYLNFVDSTNEKHLIFLGC